MYKFSTFYYFLDNSYITQLTKVLKLFLDDFIEIVFSSLKEHDIDAFVKYKELKYFVTNAAKLQQTLGFISNQVFEVKT
jgi:hypothetical protein